MQEIPDPFSRFVESLNTKLEFDGFCNCCWVVTPNQKLRESKDLFGYIRWYCVDCFVEGKIEREKAPFYITWAKPDIRARIDREIISKQVPDPLCAHCRIRYQGARIKLREYPIKNGKADVRDSEHLLCLYCLATVPPEKTKWVPKVMASLIQLHM